MKAILRRLALGLIALVMMAVAAGVLVVAAAYALFALVRGPLGPSGAAACTAGAAALLIGLVGLAFAGLARPAKRRPAAADDQDLLQRLIALARDRPIISGGALIGLVTMALRNPALITILLKAFLEPKPRSESKKKART